METEKKKIVIVGTAHPFRGGLAAFNERLAKALISEGHEVIIYTFSLQYPGFLFPGKTQYADSAVQEGLSIYVRINSVNPLNWIRVGRALKKLNADITIFCYWMSFFSPCYGTISRISRTKKTKHLALIHNMIAHEPSLLDKLLPKYFVKAMDGFVAMSDSVKEDIAKFDSHNKPVIVSPHPVYDHYGEGVSKEVAAKHLGLNEAYNYILFFGFIRPYKGLDLLLKAFADKRLRNKNIKLIVAGEFYEDEKPYMELIDNLGLSDEVILKTEFIPDSEVKYYFNVCDMVVQPYKSATQSGVTQIAYFYEKPMLVTNVGGLAEIVPHNKVGYVVDVDALKIADALVDFFEKERGSEFGSHIKTEKKRFMWDKMAQAFLKL